MGAKSSLLKRLTVTGVLLLGPLGIAGEVLADDGALLRECARDLCGEPNSYLNLAQMVTAKKAIVPAVAQEFNEALRPLLEMWLTQSHESLKKQVLSSADGIIEMLKAPLTANEIVINNLTWAMSHDKIDELLAAAKPDASGKATIDRAKAAKILAGVSALDQAHLVNFVEVIANLSEYRELVFLSKDSYGSLMALIYPAQTLKAASALDGQHYLSLQNYLMSIDPKLNFLTSITKQNLTNLALGKEVVLNSDTQWRIARARLSLALYAKVLAAGPTRELFLKRRLNFDAAQIAAKVNRVTAQFKSVVLDDGKMQGRKKKVLDECLQSYNYARNAAPTEAELSQLQAQIAAIKAASETLAGEWLGSASAGPAKSAIQSTEFLLPSTSSQVTSAYLKAVQDMMKSDAQDAALTATPQWVSRYGVDFPDTISEQMIFYSITNLCSNLQPAGLSDHALTSLGKVSLSWPTIKSPAIGLGVIAHELAHVVSRASGASPSTSFQQIRQCTVMRHLTLSNPVFAQNTDYVEEDWADTFAAQVIKRTRGSNPLSGQNYACLFLAKEGDAYGTAKEPLEMDEAEASDTHSTGLFRTMQLQAELGSLPGSCERIAKVQGHGYFNRCGQ